MEWKLIDLNLLQNLAKISYWHMYYKFNVLILLKQLSEKELTNFLVTIYILLNINIEKPVIFYLFLLLHFYFHEQVLF